MMLLSAKTCSMPCIHAVHVCEMAAAYHHAPSLLHIASYSTAASTASLLILTYTKVVFTTMNVNKKERKGAGYAIKCLCLTGLMHL